MPPGDSGSEPLPELRPELQIIAGAPNGRGAATWLIHDPVRHRFVQMDAVTRDVLSLWRSVPDRAALKQEADSRLALKLSDDRIQALIDFIERNELAVEPSGGGWRQLNRRRELGQKSTASKLIHNYLFFRIPLFRPQAFLARTAPLTAPFFSRAFFFVALIAAVVGIYFVSKQWDAFLTTGASLFTWQGMLAFGLALLLVKAAHELGHAYAAIRYGASVPTIGVAFMLLFPLLYTDVTDTWRFQRRRERLVVDTAGIAVELMIAAFATLAWVFLPDGPARSTAFMLATASWLMSLAINLNPFMKFDGYYIISGMTGIDNLQPRAFAVGRWALREFLFRPSEPCPESMPRQNIRWLALYAYGVWIYRLFLFIGIAILVYVTTFKVLGILLFLIEIIFLVLRPIAAEIMEWIKMRKAIMTTRRTLVTFGFVCTGLALLFVPWSRTVIFPAVLTLDDQFQAHASSSARVIKVMVATGARVEAGQELIRLDDPELSHRWAVAERRLRLVQLRLGRASADDREQGEALVLRREREALASKIAGLARERQKLRIKSPKPGVVLERWQRLHEGRWVTPTDRLALVGHGSVWIARGYIDEQSVWRVAVGNAGRFIPDNPAGRSANVRLTALGARGAESIRVAGLAATDGGSIAVEPDDEGRPVPTSAQYEARLAVDFEPIGAARTQRGVIHLEGHPESVVARLWRRILKVIAQEAGA